MLSAVSVHTVLKSGRGWMVEPIIGTGRNLCSCDSNERWHHDDITV
jgi:hypothetical protein